MTRASRRLDEQDTDSDARFAQTLPAPHVERFATMGRGTVLGRYLVLEHLGTGGMGVVYLARDPELDRNVALKLLKTAAGPNARARLLLEAQSMAKVSHPNVISVFDVGTVENEVFIAMEFIEGVTLSRWLNVRSREWYEILDIFLDVGRGLIAAHGAGLIHRDLKPDNVMIGGDGRVRVMDFGLARVSDGSEGGTATDLSENLTRSGAMLGTPAYMSPEQWTGAHVSAQSDQFSFCVALWEAVYGERPFRAQSLPALMMAVTEGAITRPDHATRAPVQLLTHLERGLSVDADRRWPSMTHLLDVLVELRGQASPGAFRASKVLALVSAVGLALSPFFVSMTYKPTMGVFVGDETDPSGAIGLVPALIACALILRARRPSPWLGALAIFGSFSSGVSFAWHCYIVRLLRLLGFQIQTAFDWDSIGPGSHLQVSAGLVLLLAGVAHATSTHAIRIMCAELRVRIIKVRSWRPSRRMLVGFLVALIASVAFWIIKWATAPPMSLSIDNNW